MSCFFLVDELTNRLLFFFFPEDVPAIDKPVDSMARMQHPASRDAEVCHGNRQGGCRHKSEKTIAAFAHPSARSLDIDVCDEEIVQHIDVKRISADVFQLCSSSFGSNYKEISQGL